MSLKSMAPSDSTTKMVESEGAMDFTDSATAISFALIGLCWMAAAMIHIGSAFYSLLQPRRGLQDWLAGTQLVPS